MPGSRVVLYGLIAGWATIASYIAPADATATAPPSQPDCAIAEDGEPIASVGVSEPVNPAHAPRPANDAERLVFRQLYDTLVQVDCMGHLRAGLAVSWQLAADGRWIVGLRDDARFADGTPVTPNDVVASWSRNSELRPEVRRIVESVTIIDGGIAIALRRRSADGPTALAHADLAIAKPATDSAWPMGTRGARIATDGEKSRIKGATVLTVTRADAPPLRIVSASGDARDLLDDGVDLLLSRDRATLDYARTLPQMQLVPLAWQRVRVLLAPGRRRTASMPSDQTRQVLAADAIRGESRGAQEPFWWQSIDGCDVASSPSPRSSLVPRITYDAGDGAARDLAERLVALVRGSGTATATWLEMLLPDRPRRSFQRAVGLTGTALAQALRVGGDAGYVVSVESRPLDACRELQALMDAAPWLDPGTIMPLVETRQHAIIRRGRSGIAADWDGGLVIASTSRQRPQ